MIGGQLGLHAWIETPDSIIDPTLCAETHHALRSGARHHAILRLTEDDIRICYGNLDRGPGNRLELIVSEDDPEIERLRPILDPP